MNTLMLQTNQRTVTKFALTYIKIDLYVSVSLATILRALHKNDGKI